MHDHYIDHTTLTKGCCSKLFVCLSCEKITNFTTFKHDIDTTQTADVILVLSSIFRCYNFRVLRFSKIIQCTKKAYVVWVSSVVPQHCICATEWDWWSINHYLITQSLSSTPYNTAIWHKGPKLKSILTRGLYQEFFYHNPLSKYVLTFVQWII